MRVTVLAISVLLWAQAAAWADSPASTPTVGMEGQVVLTLPGGMLEAKAVDEKAAIVLRIARSSPAAGGIEYDLRYIGFVPGQFDLKPLLQRSDGSSTADLPKIQVEVTRLLPPEHTGDLVPQAVKPLPYLGGYRVAMIAAGVVWIVLLVAILVFRRGGKPPVPAPPPRARTLAEQLRPLVELAAAGKLSTDGQGELERLLLWHWRRRLGLVDADAAAAIMTMRRHPEAGELLRALERWLHCPPGREQVDVASVLAPYQNIPVDAPEEVSAA